MYVDLCVVSSAHISDVMHDVLSGAGVAVPVDKLAANTHDPAENFWMYAERYTGMMLMVSAGQELAFLDVRKKCFTLERNETREMRMDGGGKVRLHCYLRYPMPGEMLDAALIYTPKGEYVYINISMKPVRIPELIANEIMLVNSIEKVVR